MARAKERYDAEHIEATLKDLKRVAAQLLQAAKLLNVKARAEPAPKGTRITVRSYTKVWIEGRKKRDLASAHDSDVRMRQYVWPTIGKMRLADVRARDIRELMFGLRARVGTTRDQLSSRTVRHVYGDLHRFFADAVSDELLPSSPCVLRRGELPEKIDKDPGWRVRAVFSREEVAHLTSAAITDDRRLLYTLLTCTGLRFGEAAALRWKHYETDAKPLGRLIVAASYSYAKRREKGVKTGRPRCIPVHPVLAARLAEWRSAGWETMIGRPPTADDLVIPGREGAHRSVTRMRYRLHEDLERINAPPRRIHDFRRTFVSLCLADGARKDVLRWVSHGAPMDVMDMYTTLPWDALCAEVAKLRIGHAAWTLAGEATAASARLAITQW
jgi:integrase